MCVIDSDYIDEGGSGNPQGAGFAVYFHAIHSAENEK